MKPQSLRSIYKHKPNATDDFLIGYGFLSRGGSVLVCGEPGCGKSKYAQHLAFSLALGRPFLGLKPARALKVVYIQAEDTMDDLHESLTGFVEQHGLGDVDLETMDANCICLHGAGYAGDDFICELKEAVEKYKPDVVITDPLLAFVGCDLTNQTGVTEFLRAGVAPVLVDRRCGWICVHHAAKAATGKFTGGSKVAKALGSIEIAAFFRGVIDLERRPGDPEALVMEVTKRAKQAQLRGTDGRLLHKLTIRTGGERIAWTVDETSGMAPASKPAPAGRPAKTDPKEVRAFVAKERAAGKSAAAVVKLVSSRFGYSPKQARRLVK